MPLFTPSDADAIVAVFTDRHDALARALGRAVGPPDAVAATDPPLRKDLLRLIDVANGVFDRTDSNVRRADLALGRVMQLLHTTALAGHATLTDEFWSTTLGTLVSRARWWVSADELLTISNAAALAFGENSQANRMRITRAIERGELEWVPDPSVANPQHSKRVLRAQIEQLRDRRRPAAFR